MIIGLIAGGVLVGKEMIEQYRLRNLVSDFKDYQAAFYTFTLKYDCSPGDCKNATQFFGTTDIHGNTVYNGNDNDLVDSYSEDMGAWQQLALAGLIPGQYTGGFLPGSPRIVVGENFPSVDYEHNTLAWSWRYTTSIVSNSISGNFLRILNNADGLWLYTGNGGAPVLTAREVFDLDNKLDDGTPFAGKARLEGYPYVNHCFTSAAANIYYIAYSGRLCTLALLID